MPTGTLVRTIALIVTWANMALVNYGLQPIPVVDNETLALILAAVATVFAWFKNNYVTLFGRKQKKALDQAGLTNRTK